MLKLFGAGADHPMRDPKEARRILDALPADDVKALEELAHWHESVSAAEGFKLPERAGLLLAMDEAAQPRVRKLTREYCGAVRPSRYQEHRVWTHLHEYWKQAALAFGRAVDAAAPGKALDAKTLPLVATRALRAAAQQIKWQHMRYGPVDPATWGIVNRVFAFCDARGFGEGKLALYPGAETSPRQEFLRAVMFSASSPDSLLAAEADYAERIIADLSPHFLLAPAPAPGLIYWTDVIHAMAPLRLVKPPQSSPGVRYFGPGNALMGLQALIQKNEAMRDAEAEVEVLKHLAMLWSPEPPERRHARHNVKSRLTVAHGFAGAVEALGGAHSLDFNQKAAESWVVENVSAGGFGALVPQVKADWLHVGALIALQPDGGTNWIVGAVRRVNRITPTEARVGIETLSRAPRVARFRLRGLGEETALLLPSAVLGSGEVSIALRSGVYPPGTTLEATLDGREHVYLPQGAPERSDDYELVRFREMIRES
ncbi:MAG TPA: hypothetical protein VNU64_22570 [Burkholderiales bacterium]|nr:hypothetical protein [Burkholderiales bacterium]